MVDLHKHKTYIRHKVPSSRTAKSKYTQTQTLTAALKNITAYIFQTLTEVNLYD